MCAAGSAAGEGCGQMDAVWKGATRKRNKLVRHVRECDRRWRTDVRECGRNGTEIHQLRQMCASQVQRYERLSASTKGVNQRSADVT